MQVFRVPLTVRVVTPDLTVTVSLLSANTVLITFSEPVTGFDETHITITGGSLSNFAGNRREFTVNVERTETQATVFVRAGVATSYGRTNVESNRLVIT